MLRNLNEYSYILNRSKVILIYPRLLKFITSPICKV